MDTQASKEKKAISVIEKVVLYSLYVLFGVINTAVIVSGDFEGLLVVLPITVISIWLTKWGMKWQNERYLRSAENQDEIEYLKKKVDNLEKRIFNLEE